MTIEDFNKQNGCNLSYGDYTFDDNGETETPIDTLRQQFLDDCMSSEKEELRALQGIPIYTPKNIYVLTDNRTFSAAFHYAFFLWRMGAKVVGVPSSQAPNTYMEVTPFELPHTKIRGSISNSMQVFLPHDDKRAKIFWPDRMPTYKDYKKYHFDKQSEVMFLLNNIR